MIDYTYPYFYYTLERFSGVFRVRTWLGIVAIVKTGGRMDDHFRSVYQVRPE